MNMISFANFDNLDNSTNFFQQAKTDEKTEDFSSILNSIFVTLQPPVSPVKASVAEVPTGDSQVCLEVAPTQDFSLVKNQKDDNLLELPGFEQKVPFSSDVEPATSIPTTQTLWAGFSESRQRKPQLQSQIIKDDKFTQQINNLFQAEPNPKFDLPEKFNKLPFFGSSDLKNKLPNFPNLQPVRQGIKTTETAVLPQLFQANPHPVNQTDLPKQNDFSTLTNAVTEEFVLPENLQNLNIQNDSTVSIKVESATQFPAASFNSSDSNSPDIISQPIFPEIVLKPTYINNKLAGFDITPNEVHSILKTFDGFLKNPVSKPQILETSVPVETVDNSVKNVKSAINFGNSPEYQSPDIWWNPQGNTSRSTKSPKVEILNNLNLKTDAKITTQAQPAETIEFIGFETNPSSAIKETSVSTENGQTFDFEQNKPEVKENDLNTAVKFDNFLESVSKKQKTVETLAKTDVEPAKFAEQINPHLLELAALTVKKGEKQMLKLRLNPAELGTVEIKLERNNSGTLNAFFQTETDGARAALTNNLEQLRDTLQNAGWQIGQMEITSGSFSSFANGQNESNSRQSDSVENYSFNRNSDKPDDLESNASNRLLSLQA